MARDFAKTGAKNKRAPAKKSGAKKAPVKKTAAKNSGNGAPAGLIFFAGFISGLFVAFLIYLSGVVPKTITPSTNNTGADNKPEVVEKKPEKKIDFEFYKMLQEQEVEVEPVEPVESRAEAEKKFVYMLQVASFRSLPDADRLKASLILENGMTVNIRTINGSNGTWHKVIAGPFETRSQSASARSVLAQRGFKAMEFKRPIQ